MQYKVRSSVTFDQDIIDRIEKYKGRLSRSTWLNQLADVELTRLENEEKQARSS